MSDKIVEEEFLERNIKIRAQQILSKTGLSEIIKFIQKVLNLMKKILKNFNFK